MQKYTPHLHLAQSDHAKKAILEEGHYQTRRTVKRYLLSEDARIFLAYEHDSGRPAGLAMWHIEHAMSAGSDSHNSDTIGPRLRLPLWKHVIRMLMDTSDALTLALSRFNLHWLVLSSKLRVQTLQRERMWAEHTEGVENRCISTSDRKHGFLQLSILGVHPAFGGRGIAKRLVQWGLDKADNEDVSVYLSASPKGMPIYKKMGFKVIDPVLCYPDDPQGGWVETFMVRPRPSERKESDKRDTVGYEL